MNLELLQVTPFFFSVKLLVLPKLTTFYSISGVIMSLRTFCFSLVLTLVLTPSAADSNDFRLSASAGAAMPVSGANSIKVGGGYALSIEIPINTIGDHVWLGFQGSHMPLENDGTDVTLQMLMAGMNVSLVREHATLTPYVVGGIGANIDGWSAAYWMLGLGADYEVLPSLMVFGELVPVVQFDPSSVPLLNVRTGVRYLIGN